MLRCKSCNKNLDTNPPILIINGVEVEEDLCSSCLKIVQDDLETYFPGHEDLEEGGG